MASVRFDREINQLKRFQEELSSGIDIITTVAKECVSNRSFIEENEMDELKLIAQDIAELDYDSRLFLKAADNAQNEIKNCEYSGDTEALLNSEIERAKGQVHSETKLKATVKELSKFLDHSLSGSDNQVVGEGDESMLVTATAYIPKDPITQTLVKTAVKNRHCNHIYDKDSILVYIKGKNRRCPCTGCANRHYIEEEDLIPDMEVQNLIDQEVRATQK